jgi:hypothetical protein
MGERLSGPGYTPEIKTGAYTEKQPAQSQARSTKPMGQAAIRASSISNPSAKAVSKPMGRAAVQASKLQSKSASTKQSMGRSATRGSSKGRPR